LNNIIKIYKQEILAKPTIEKNPVPIKKFEQSLFFKSALVSGISISNSLSLRFIASLLTKPFVILTGLSGSGKTKLAQSFAMWICENEDQYCLVPVGADWTNREPLLGFPNALKSNEYIKPDNRVLDLLISAIENQDKPYFLILDEMNLSHVERYFADFLSVMESGRKFSLHNGLEYWNDVPAEIELPNNLFIIGTVNIDETTYMFSPKVLDRANVIEFRVTAEEMKKNTILELDKLKSAGADMAASFIKLAKDKLLKTNDSQVLQTELLNFFSELKKTGAEFGYRSASEIFRFAAVVNKLEPDWSMTKIIDAAIMQKLLPKVHGSRRKLEPVLKTLGSLCLQSGQNIFFLSLGTYFVTVFRLSLRLKLTNMEKKNIYKVVKKEPGESDNAGEPVIQFMKIKVLTEEEKAVRNSLGRISINARRKAYRKKSAVTIIRNGKILRIHSNRKVKSVGVVKKIEVQGDLTKPIKIK